MKELYQYFVEGADETHLIETLKTNMRLIKPGKIQILNVVQERISDLKLRVIADGTILVFVFDTDVGATEILYENIKKASKTPNVKQVLCITQVKNIEDELVRSTNITSIEELLNSRSKTDFKRDFLRERNVKQKLESHCFDIKKLWCKNPPEPFTQIRNDAKLIKNND